MKKTVFFIFIFTLFVWPVGNAFAASVYVHDYDFGADGGCQITYANGGPEMLFFKTALNTAEQNSLTVYGTGEYYLPGGFPEPYTGYRVGTILVESALDIGRNFELTALLTLSTVFGYVTVLPDGATIITSHGDASGGLITWGWFYIFSKNADLLDPDRVMVEYFGRDPDSWIFRMTPVGPSGDSSFPYASSLSFECVQRNLSIGDGADSDLDGIVREASMGLKITIDLTPVPIPGVIWLLASGLAALGLGRGFFRRLIF